LGLVIEPWNGHLLSLMIYIFYKCTTPFRFFRH
jgi:hypothetical protein